MNRTRHTGLRGTDRKVAGDRTSATFRCYHSATKTHGYIALHQPPVLLVHKRLLNCKTMALRTVSASSVSGYVIFLLRVRPCFSVALLHDVIMA